MNKKKIRKVLIIVSVIIMTFGVFLGITIFSELDLDFENENFMIDGSDFTPFAKAFLTIGAATVSILPVIACAIILLIIWAIYGIISLIFKVIDKSKLKQENKNKFKKFTIIAITVILIFIVSLIILNNFNKEIREEYTIIEQYVLENYNMELTTLKMVSIDRGDIGINPGKSYVFTMKDINKTEYTVTVDTYERHKSFQEIISNNSFIKDFKIDKK